MSIRTFVNKDKTVLVQLLTVEAGSLVHVATREHPDHVWSPPVVLLEEGRS